MVARSLLNAMMLYELMKKIRNGSTYVIVNDEMGSVIEKMFSLLILRGDDCPSLHTHLEASEEMCDCFKQAGCKCEITQLRDACAQELHVRGKHESLACKPLIG